MKAQKKTEYSTLNIMEKNQKQDFGSGITGILRSISILLQGLGLGSFITGVMNLYFAIPGIEWPMVSASGIWAGLMAIAVGVVGYAGNYSSDVIQTPRGKQLALALFVLVIISLTTGSIHFVYSTCGLVTCAMGQTPPCEDADRFLKVLTTEALNVAFGVLITSLSTTALVIMNWNKAFQDRIQTRPGDINTIGC